MSERLNARQARAPIEDLVGGPAVVVEPRTSLRQVAKKLGDLGIGIVVVMEDGAVTGVVSERDLVWAIARDADLDAVWAADVMTPEADLLSVPPDTSVGAAAAAMAAKNTRHILVDYPDTPAVVSIRTVLERLIE